MLNFPFDRFWPEEMRRRVKSTYLYFAGGLGVTALSAYAVSKSNAVYTMMRANRWLVCMILDAF